MPRVPVCFPKRERSAVIERVLAWSGPDRFEYCHVWEHLGSLSARGTLLCAGYRVEYELDTAPGFHPKRLRVRANAPSVDRTLWLRRDVDGEWSARGDGEPAAPPDATDIDLGGSAFLAGLPLLRHPLHLRLGRRNVVLAAITLPGLSVRRSTRTLTHLKPGAVRIGAGTAAEDLTVDDDGYVLIWPGVAQRVLPADPAQPRAQDG